MVGSAQRKAVSGHQEEQFRRRSSLHLRRSPCVASVEMVLPEKLKKQLALAVRSIHWSYGIFWSGSATQPGVLSWGEGYYNGDIKTRKTSQGVEQNSEDICLQRSEQLRELYAFLTIAEASSQTKRPSAALSPEDLTDAEWFYLVCMSFVFNIGQCLPGRTLANGQPVWLCNAPDNRVFCRSLLARSASIQTVVCFPFLEGVIELGTTDLVSEDQSLIQRIRTCFLDILESNLPNKSGATLNSRNNEDGACTSFDQNAYGLKLTPEVVGYEQINITSPNSSSNALQSSQPADGTFIGERINGSASKVQSWQVMDDELSNCVHNNSMNSSDCLSQTLASPQKIAFVPSAEQDFQECKTTLEDRQSDDKHYHRLLSALLKRADQLIMGVHFQDFRQESSFVVWKQQGPKGCQMPRGGAPQKLLRKVLFEVPRMHMDGLLESQEDCKEGMSPDADEIGMNHISSERNRRARLNERFSTLRSMVPMISKDDKVSILDDAIEYLRKLEKKVRELEAQRELIELDTEAKRTPQDMVERTFGNYCNNKIDNGKKSVSNKRKACEAEETGREIRSEALKESSNVNVTICMNDTEVLIEMNCPWREGVLLETVEALGSLHLDCHSVQSSEDDGSLYLTIKSKFRGSTVASAKRIRHTLQKAALKC